ncbi:uncharacterized protein BJ171DRAFT_487370 [Polychytrium aggregatum]|uniref:uncharacterized protein n=1 Tax=Polychytrium aggregatum TaxID=110093 RepID=UPI0022FE2BDA|nr:uncharacterized protein BJ171DRAFT_487370 [Polychytrium aggregatum]KAI9208805.1 hypothetical protein BJ171DRAFT_487370 [Polychytrium aggregatum]
MPLTQNPPVPASASSKKKKVKKPISPEKYNALLASKYPFNISNSNAKGRHALATTDIAPGTIVYEEKAYTLIVAHPSKDQFCHHCIEPIKEEAKDEIIRCEACDSVLYCGNECKELNAAHHELECPVLPKLVEIAQEHNINVDLLRLILGILTRKTLQESGNESSHDSLSPWDCVVDLSVHREAFDKTWIKSISDAAAKVVELLPENMKLPTNEVVDLACRINSNAHSMQDTEGKTQVAAFGLFPLGSLFFRHSCAPNVHFSGEKGRFTYRAIKEIKAGQEILVSHVADLYAPRSDRRQELMISKHIKCDCSRCKVPMAKSLDRFVDGFLCESCHTGIYLPEFQDIPVEAKEGDVVPAEESQTPQRRLVIKCDHCDYVANDRRLAEIRNNLVREYKANIELLQQQNLKDASKGLQTWIETYATGGRYVHPYNAILLNTRVNLLNVLTLLGEFEAALQVNRDLIATYEASELIPRNWPDMAELYNNLGELMAHVAKLRLKAPVEPEADTPRQHQQPTNRSQLKGRAAINAAASSKKPLTPAQVAKANEAASKKLAKEALGAFARAYEISSVVFGEDSKKAQEYKAKAKI